MTQSIAAEVLQEARRQSALSQADLAAAAGTYQSVIGRIEAGKTSPSLETLSRLVKAAGFEIKVALEPLPFADPMIEAYKPGIDQSVLVENLRISVDERLRINAQLGGTSDAAELARAKRAAEQNR